MGAEELVPDEGSEAFLSDILFSQCFGSKSVNLMPFWILFEQFCSLSPDLIDLQAPNFRAQHR